MKYKLAQNTIPKEDIDKLIEWLKTYPPLTMAAGTLTKQFEEEWSKTIGVRYSVFCNSGSSANLLAYSAIINTSSPSFYKKHVVLCSAGWSTTLSPLLERQIPCVLCDADRDTFGIDMKSLKYLLDTMDISLVVLVHTLGVPNRMNEILGLKELYGFLLMEDSCPAVGSKYNDQYTGTFGDISTFSFYYGHQLSTIEGGMVCTNDESLYHALLTLRSHGWGKNLPLNIRHEAELQNRIDEHHSDFTFYSDGYNLRPTEINAFLGLEQIKRLPYITNVRNFNFQHYRNLLKNKFIVQNPPMHSTVSCITFPFITNGAAEARKVFEVLKKEEIETRPISGGSLGLQPFWFAYNGDYSSFSFADKLHKFGFVLPCHPEMRLEDIDYICDLLLNI
jgi:CDP-6-deoxy-D-xylo-4-hexulose-3-dehydrase